MATRINNGVIRDGVSWKDKYSISDAAADVVKVGVCFAAEGGEVVRLICDGAITLTDYNNLPVGSEVLDTVGFTYNLKCGATTWKSETLS